MDNALAQGELVAVRRGVLAAAAELEQRSGRALHETQLHAALLAFSGDWHAARRSAAVLHGLPLLGAGPRVPLLVREKKQPTERSSSRFRRLAALPPEERTTARGLPVTSLARTVFDLARSESFRSGVVVADAALRAGLSPADLEACMERHRGWPGSRAARAVAEFADGRAESPLESLARVAARTTGLPAFEPQVEVWRYGRFVARVDGLWWDHLLVFEGDGAEKLLSGQDPELVARQEAIRDCGLDVVRARWSDVYNQQDAWAARVRARRATRDGAQLPPGVELVSTAVRLTPASELDTYRWPS